MYAWAYPVGSEQLQKTNIHVHAKDTEMQTEDTI